MRVRLFIFVVGLLIGLPAASAAASLPVIDEESVSHLTSGDVTLEARINPESTERGVYYQFQIVTDPTKYPVEFTCPIEGLPAGGSFCLAAPPESGVPPIGWIGPATEDKTVSFDLNSAGMSLQPNTTYYWRVIAARSVPTIDTIEWEEPIVHGTKMAFSTPGEGSPPTIESTSVSNVTATDATLEAWINPGGSETTYEFFIVENWNWGGEMPEELELLAAGQLPASGEGQHVTLDLNSVGMTLAPDEIYEFAVTAENAVGAAFGVFQVSTPALPPEEEPGPPEEEPGVTEPPLQDGSSGALQGEEMTPPLPAGGAVQGPPTAKPCGRAPHRHHGKRHRHHRVGIATACRWA